MGKLTKKGICLHLIDSIFLAGITNMNTAELFHQSYKEGNNDHNQYITFYLQNVYNCHSQANFQSQLKSSSDSFPILKKSMKEQGSGVKYFPNLHYSNHLHKYYICIYRRNIHHTSLLHLCQPKHDFPHCWYPIDKQRHSALFKY
jgi:hypothetical protein